MFLRLHVPFGGKHWLLASNALRILPLSGPQNRRRRAAAAASAAAAIAAAAAKLSQFTFVCNVVTSHGAGA